MKGKEYRRYVPPFTASPLAVSPVAEIPAQMYTMTYMTGSETYMTGSEWNS